MVDNNPNTQAQIRSHILDLTRNSLFSVPGLVTPGGTPIGPGAPGSGLFLPDSSFLAQPLKDLIKVNSAGAKEEKQPEKKDKAR